VVSYDLFHTGLTGLDPTQVPFPSSVIDVSRGVYEDLATGTDKIRLAGIHLKCIQTGHEISENDGRIMSKGEYPILGSKVYRPTDAMLGKFFNRSLTVDDGAIVVGHYTSARDPIHVLADPEKMARLHVGVFGSTGAGKSFLISNLVTRSLERGIRHVIFDVAPEFPALLSDVLYRYVRMLKTDWKTAIIARRLEDIQTISNLDNFEEISRLFNTPDDLREKYRDQLTDLLNRSFSSVDPVPKILLPVLTTEEIVRFVQDALKMKRFPQAEQLSRGLSETLEFKFPSATFAKNKAPLEDLVGEVRSIDDVLHCFDEELQSMSEEDVSHKFLTALQMTIDNFATQRDRELLRYLEEIRKHRLRKGHVMSPRDLVRPCLEDDMMLQIVISHTDDATKYLISTAINAAFDIQKRAHRRRTLVFVIDEAHNFAPNQPTSSSSAIERLAREGRKNSLGLLLASQRCAYLNSSTIHGNKEYAYSHRR
jgi:DNA helicase HerA-like ATPase